MDHFFKTKHCIFNKLFNLNLSFKGLFPYIEEKRIKATFDYFKSMGRSNFNCLEMATEHLLMVDPNAPKISPSRPQKPPIKQTQRSLESDVKEVMSIITDCVPDFIETELKKYGDRPDRIAIVVSALVLEKNPYPKLKDYLDTKNREKENENLKKVNTDSQTSFINFLFNLLFLKFDIVEFCKMYKEPSKYFSETTATMSQSYIQHCQVELKNKCLFLSEESVEKALKDFNYHLLPAYRELTVAYSDQERSLLLRIQKHVAPEIQYRANEYARLNNGQPFTIEIQNALLRNFRKSKN